MTLTQLAPPYPIFTDKSGSPLDNGYLYFGTANLNPETNPIAVYYDSALTQPAAQPLRTSNGYVMRNGSPTILYANSQFSVTVRDKKKALVIYSPVGYGILPAYFNNVTDLLADTGSWPVGQLLNTRAEGFAYQVAASGATDYHVTTAGGVKLYVLRVAIGKVTPQQFGAKGDGTTDDRPAFVALNTFGGDVYIPKPSVSYNVSSAINLDRPGITVDPTVSWEALTDTGLITWNQNLFTQQSPPVPVHRFSGRMFLGDAAHEMAGGWDNAVSGTNDRGPDAWYADETPIFGGYTTRDATVVIANGKGTVGLAVSARSSDRWNAAWNDPIGFSSFVVNDAGRTVWGGIIEGKHTVDPGFTFGVEFALGNSSGITRKATPYNSNGGGGVVGLWMAGAGDARYGTPSNASNNSPMIILKNQTNTTLDGGWATGVVITGNALTGTDGSAASTGFSSAISMARNHRVEWYEPTNSGVGFSITSQVTNAAGSLQLRAFNNSLYFMRGGTGGVRFAEIRDDTTGVDYPVFQNGTGTVRLNGEGDSSDINIFLSPKGTGRVRFGTRTASGDVPVTGYIEILDAGGTVRRLAVVG